MNNSRGQNERENLDWFGESPPTAVGGDFYEPWENWKMFCQGNEGECQNASHVYYIEADQFLCFDCADLVIT